MEKRGWQSIFFAGQLFVLEAVVEQFVNFLYRQIFHQIAEGIYLYIKALYLFRCGIFFRGIGWFVFIVIHNFQVDSGLFYI
jgi:hypothetical protein